MTVPPGTMELQFARESDDGQRVIAMGSKFTNRILVSPGAKAGAVPGVSDSGISMGGGRMTGSPGGPLLVLLTVTAKSSVATMRRLSCVVRSRPRDRTKWCAAYQSCAS